MAAVGDPPFVVNNTNDKVDANINGTCAASVEVADKCTLRAAIQEANARPGADLIYVLPGTYKISIPPINENAANVGDFELLDPVRIEKAPSYLGDVIIDGGDPLPSSPTHARGIDRLFEIHPGAGDVTLKDVTLQNGYAAEEGGAIQNWSLGKLTLDEVTVKDSYAEKSGGGLNHADIKDYPWTTEPPNLELMPYGRVEIKRSTFTGNGASEFGAAINNVSGGTITISDGSVITLNPGPIMPNPLDPEEFILVDPSDYMLGPSAISNESRENISGTIKISDSTVSLNASGTPGAGIANWVDGVVTIEGDSKLTQNRTSSEGGGLFTEGGKVSVSDSEVSKNQAANGGGLYSGGHVSMFGLRGSFDVKNAQIFENKAENGGGIYNNGEAQLFVSDTTFTKNVSTDHGAAITSEARGSMTLTRVNVVENESNGEGGGVWTHSERLQSIVDSTFARNKAGVPMIEDGVLSDDVAGGGGLYTDGGPVTVVSTTFEENEATNEGGGLSIHNLGDIVLRDSVVKNNRAYDGGGLENSATRVDFERMTVQGNRAGNAGGGIYNTSSGPFSIVDSAIRDNVGVIGGGMANAPDNDLIIKGSLFLNNSARIARNDEGVIEEEAGHGGGLMSFADGESLIENTTFSGNKAAAAGGGLFHDADGALHLVHITVWRNSAPAGGGIGVRESDFVPPIPPAANSAVIVKNSIVGGSLEGGGCDWYVRSEGGNLETGDTNTCFLAVTAETAESPIELGVRDRRGDPDLWAIADNGGPTMTHALQYGSFAIDSSEAPCSTVDQRGEERPQNGKCDAGAYEFVGPPPAEDTMPPETYFTPGVDGPRQNSYETMAFTFRGEDKLDPNNPDGGLTAPEELNFECRFFEIDPVEQQEPVEPWLPQPPEFRWNGCSSPWQTILFEEGMSRFEVRAIDRAGNVDPTPVEYVLSADNLPPPDTVIVDKPPLQTNNRSALFSFKGISDFTPPQWFEYECRLDSNDPEMWLECFNPAMYSNLSTGLHTFEVRAATEVGGFEGDPSPARYTWRVGPDPNAPPEDATPPLTCDEANITLTASADGWADQVTPTEGYMFHTELEVRSAANDPGNGQPIVPMNARAFFRFPLSNDAPDCELVSATLRLHSGGHTEGRKLEAVPLEDTWKESTLTWVSQPDPYPGVAPALTDAGELYREWDVKDHVEAILAGDLPAYGWVIRDLQESDPVEGGEQSFTSREMPQVPPYEVTLPELELRFEAADTPAPEPPDETLVDRNDVACGEVITESTRLTADVTGCQGEGIAIGAPNIILDLNGHTVRGGLVLEPGEEDGLFPAIRNNHSNVVIRNGVVTNFGHGVLLGPGSMYSVVENMTLYRLAGAGIQLFDADNGRVGVTVRGNRFDSNGLGVELVGGTEGSTVEGNFFVATAMSIYLNAANRNVIRNNEISGLILDPTLDSDAGIVVENGSRDNVLENNDVSDTGDAGIKIHQGSHGNIVRGGDLVRNGDAGVIAELSDRIEIDGVTSHQQSDGGVVIGNSSGSTVKNSDLRFNPSGVAASNTNELLVQNNEVSDSLQAGIELGNGVGMIVRDNTANRTGGSGISLEGAAIDANGAAHGGALIEGNTANQNKQDGFSIAPGKHTIRDNDAHNNSGFGIAAGEAGPGDPNVANIDGGGNRASGNTEPIQCLGVFCDTGDAELVGPDLTPPETILVDGPLGPNPSPTGSTGSETAVFEFRGEDGPAGTPPSAMIFECRLDAPPDPPLPPEDPELEPPDPNQPPDVPEPLEGEGWGECVSPHTLLSLEPGTHVFEIRAHDWAGNFDLTPVKYEWTIHAGVDEQGQSEFPPFPPETRITAAPGELTELRNEDGEPLLDANGEPVVFLGTTNRAASFKFTGSDNLTAGYNIAYECRQYFEKFNSALEPEDLPSETELPFGPCVSPKQYTNLAYGGHIFQVRAVDLAGNEDVTPAWHSWWIQPPPPDTTPPDTTIMTGPDAVTVQTTATFEFTGSDNQTPLVELEFQCRLDGAMSGGEPLWTDCTSPHTVTVASQATAVEHVFQVRSVDASGNVDDVMGTAADTQPDGVPAAYVWTVGAAPVAKTIFCGQKITQSIIANNNLGDCLGHGLIVGANGITIDLNGKTIDGKSIGAGILNNGFDSVTIKNGKLIDFDYGVMLNQGTKLNIVEGVTAEKNQDAGIALGRQTWPEDPNLAPSVPAEGFDSGVDGNILRSNTLVVNNNGAWLMNGAQDNVVRGNLIGSSAGEGVFLDRAVANLVEGNDIEIASKHAVLLEGATNNVVRENAIATAGSGVLVSATTTGTKGIESTGNRVEGNVLTDTAGPALEIEQSSDTELLDNVVTLSDSVAIELYLANDNVIRGNEVSGNKGGISLRNSISNLIEDNDASDSDTTGIVLAGGSLSNIVRNNVSSHNVGGGIYIGDETPAGQGTLVEGNTTNGNKGMGIQASKPAHIFKGNIAFDNDSWGIHAGDPSNGRANVDGGGNVADGNKGPLGVDLKPQQCHNVRCTGSPGGGDQMTPSTTLLDMPVDPSGESVAVFRFTGADNASPVTFECRFESTLESDWRACASPKTYNNLVNDTYTFEVRARDFSGNVDPTPESYTWAVQLDELEASIDSTPSKITVDTSATFTFSANLEVGVTFQCAVRSVDSTTAVDWASAPACTSPKTYTGLEPGQYEFWVRASDAASNYDTKMYAWTIGAAPVEAEVSCGQILTQSTKLTNDLVDCGGYGLVVGAPGITIDLDGHIVDGVGMDAGILNNGHDDVTIANGMVGQFLIGVQLNPGTARNVVHSLRVEANAEAGIALSDADQAGDGNVIRDNSITANVTGIALYSNTRNAVIRNNTLNANLGLGAIVLEFVSDNVIESNQIGKSGASGIYMIGGGGNVVRDNAIKDSGAFGINAGEELLRSNDNLVERNTIDGGAGGMIVAGDRNQVLANTVKNTTGPGVLVEMATDTLVKGNDFSGAASGISVSESTSTVLEANNASGTLGAGIAIAEMSVDTIVRNNTASGNKGDGIEVTESSMLSELSLIEGNTADGNGGEGISIEGSGHVVKSNVAQMNGGWGIYSVGGIDGGGNFAAGNMELEQCFGVVCTIGVVPGAPDTWIVDTPADVDTGTPGVQTNSRNVSVTYMGADEFTPIQELVFECRIDSVSPTAWVDCEYPAEFMNLSPGQHTLDIRAVDMMGQGLADPTPASFTWTYVPLDSGVAPEIFFDIVPPQETHLLDAIFTFHSNEPDVTFLCQVDQFGWMPCGFEGAGFMHQGGFEWTFVEQETGPHTFYVRAIDFEGNVGEASYTWTINGITVLITDGPGFIPPSGGPLGDPAMGGPVASTSAEIHFEAVPDPGDVTFMCRFDSLDPNAFFPCTSPFRVGPEYMGQTDFPEPLLLGEHALEVYGESETMASMAELEAAEYEWEVIEGANSAPPDTTIERAPGPADPSSTIFEFTGVDDLTPDFLLTYECQVTNGTPETAPPNPSAWEQCFNPFNLLDLYNYGDPEMLLTQKTFYVRAIDMVELEIVDPTQPQFEGNPDPTPAFHTWTPTADTLGPIATFSGGPADGATVGEAVEPYTFFGADNATPVLRLQFQCAVILTASGIANAEWQTCTSPGGYEISGLEPGVYTVAVRAVDLAGNIGPADTRQVTVADAPVVTFRSGPHGRLDPISGIPDGSSGTENAVFVYRADQPGVTFECSLDGAEFVPCNTPSGSVEGEYVYAAWVVTNGTHELRVRPTNAQGLVGEEALYEWLVELAPDATRPDTTITSGPPNGTLNTVATFTFTGTDNRTPSASLMFECGLDTNTAWNSCVAPQQFSDLQRGSHTLYVRAKDAAGNFDSTPASYTWIVAPPPVVAILSGPGSDGIGLEESTDRTATFEFTSDVPGATFHCWFDGRFDPAQPSNPAEPAPCLSGQTYENLGFGRHLFAVRAVDSFGNLSEWEDAEFGVIPPLARFTSVPASGTSTTATFEFASDPLDPDAPFFCSLDGRPFGPCTSPRTYTNVWPGEHTFQVQTVYTGLDWRGLPLEVEPVPVSHTWTVQDFTAPDTFIDFGPPATTLSTSAYLQVSSDDPTATIECTLNGEPAECEPGGITELNELIPGSYTFSAVAADESGNIDLSPATHSWTIGTPDGPPNTPVGENVVVTAGDVTVTFFSVETEGTTTVELLGGGPDLPEGYGGASTQIYDISTTAIYGEPVTVCINYDPDAFGGTRSLRLLHFGGDLWLDITTLHDPFSTPARICSNVVEGFSLFAIAPASSGVAPDTSILSGPDGPLGATGLPTSTSGSATFEFWADQENATTQCSVDGLPYVNCESPFTVGPLEAGEHEFLVQAVNDFGWVDLTPALYEWEILGPDTTPPTTIITKGPAEGSSTLNHIHTFEFSGTDDFTPPLDFEYQCTLDGVDLGGCETPQTIETLEAGPHTLVVRAIDAAGNVDPVGVTRNWTVVDMSFPDTDIVSGPVQETSETSATFEFTGFEEISGEPVNEFECALDQQDFAPCTSPWTLTDLAPGSHVLLVRAVDPAGNRDISPDYYEWLITAPPEADTTPPDTFITFSPTAGNSGPDVIFGFASSEQVEIFECAWGAGTPPAEPTTWEQCAAVFELQGLPSGPHWLWVRSVDLVGNVDPTPAPGVQPFVWIVNAEPETFIDSGPADPTGAFTAEFTFHSDQPNATFECAIDGFEFTPCTSPYQAGPFLPEANGAPLVHEFEVRALNEFRDANNQQVADLSPAVHAWSVQDTTPPTTEFLGVEDATQQLLEPGIRFTFRGDDDWASVFELQFECSLDNTADAEPPIVEDCSEPGANDTYMYELPYSQLAAGTYEFQVAAMDMAGNVDQTPDPVPPYRFTIEAEPETTITSSTPDVSTTVETTSRSITITFTGTGASFLCRLGDENALFTECPGGVAGQATYSDLPYGEQLFEVMSVGEFGTPDLSPAQLTWIVGTDVAPDVTITEAPADGTESTTATFRFSSTDPNAAFLCSLDGAPLVPCSSPREYTGLLAGVQNPHTFTVEATTPTLLESVVTNEATHAWTITDATPPETVLLAPLPADSTSSAVEFRFTGSDNGTIAANLQFECSLDGADFTACSSPWQLTALTAGEHTFRVRAVDQVPLTDGSPASHTWTVIAAPETTIDTFPADPSTTSSATFTFSSSQEGSFFRCSLDGAPAVACTSPREYTGLTNGGHRFEVYATNAQGVADSTPAFHEWTVVDETPPETTIDSGPDQPTTASTSAAFSFSADEPATFECSLDGAAFAPCDSPREYAVAVGQHTFTVQATDQAENTDATAATWPWEVIDGPPTPPTIEEPQPAVVTCGQVLTRSTLVQNDLTDCPGEGLVTGASNIIVDLNGHTIDGPDYVLNPPATNETLPAGIRNSGFDNVTVRNGTVQQFGDGALLNPGSTYNVLANVTFAGNAIAGVHLEDADNGTIRNSRLGGNATGILLATGSDSNVATANTFNGNLNMAIHVLGSSGNLIESNIVSGLVAGLPGSDGGIQLDGATDNVLLDNRVSDTGDYGVILVQSSHGNRIEANTLTRTGDSGVHIQDSNGNEVVGNVVREASDNGVGLSAANDSLVQGNDVRLNAGGIEVEGASSGNLIEDNDASESGGAGISIAGGGVNNTVRLNTASGNGAAGISVDGVAEGTGNLIEGNRTHANLGGGINVAGSGHTITANIANDNASWGIFAAPGNIDGGGNTAGGNAELAQCSGVTCGVSDRLAPQTTITDSPTSPTTATTAGFSFVSNEANSTFECSRDGSAFAACTSPTEYVGLAVGQHEFRVRAIDPVGNTDGSAAVHNWTIEEPPANTDVGTDVTVDVAAPDGTTATVTFAEVTGAGRTAIALGSASTLPDGFVADGARFYEIATTAAYTGPVTICIGYDPASFDNFVGLLHFAGGAWSDVTTSSDPFGGQVCGVVNSLSPFAIAEITPERAPDTQLVPPEDPILESEPGIAKVQFQFASSDPLATFQCKLDGADWTSCATPYEVTAAVGEHTLLVRAVNEAGIFDLSPATHAFTVVARPSITIGLGPEDQAPEDPDVQTELRDATFTFSSDDPSATFECRLLGETFSTSFEPCTTPKTYEDLPLDEYTFEVRAINAAGHSLFPAQFEWTVGDLTRPETTIESGPEDPTSATTATFVFSAGEPATFECLLDGLPSACSSGLTFTGLDAGQHRFEVLATDLSEQQNVELEPAVWTWTVVDEVGPETQITSVQPGSIVFHFTGSDDHTATEMLTFQCSVDSGPFEPCTSPKTYTDEEVGSGEHTFQVRAVDEAGNADPTPESHSWTVIDNEAPNTTITAAPSNPSGNAVEFGFTGSDNFTLATDLRFECSLDGAEFEACASPWPLTELAGGPHEFEVRAIDEAGVTEVSTASYPWNVIAPPLTTITNTTPQGDVPAGTTSSSATGELSFSDQPDSTYECRLDPVDADAPFASCTPPSAYDLANGTHVFEVRATTLPLDGQPVVEHPPARYEWTIDAADTTDPHTTIELAPAASTASTSATFIFSGTDNVAAAADLTFECSRDGAAFADCQSGIAYTGLSLGEHTFDVRASDTAVPPNVDDSPASHTWTIESAGAPNTPVGADVTVEVSGASLTFASVTTAGTTSISELSGAPSLPNGYVAEGAIYFEVSTTAEFAGDVTVCLPYGGLTEPHVLHYVGSQWLDVTLEVHGDLACGIVGSLSPFAAAEVTPEVAPNTTIVQSPADPTIQDRANGANVTFEFSSTLPPSEFQCSLDGATFEGCVTPYEFSTTFGEHTLRVRSISEAGVRDATPASHRWTVLARPVATIATDLVDGDQSTPGVQTESRSAQFTLGSDQAGSTFECRLTVGTQSGSWQACTSPATYESLALDDYKLEIRAIKDGNASWLPATYEWTVADLTAPIVTITSGPSNTVDQTTATFEFTSDEPATFECSRDGGVTWTAGCTSGVTYTDLGRGPHTFHVRATDLSARQNRSEPASRSWTVADLTAPTLSIGEKPAATTSETTARFTFSATDNWAGAVTTECRLDGAAFTACDSPKSYSGLAAAQHSFEVRATDSASNSRTESYSWTVQDVVDPEARITSVTSSSLSIEFTGSDNHTAVGDLRFECRVDSEPYSACTSPKTYSNADLAAMTPGQHTFQVRAIDQAGNVGQPDSRTFTVADTKAPQTTITGQPVSTTTNTTATFTFTGSDDGTAVTSLTYECSLENGIFAACTSPKEYTGLVPGTHTFQVRATDAADNTDQSPASYTWTVDAPPPAPDTTAPETSITANPPATTTETSASFSFTGTDNETPAANLTFECQLDTGSYAACTTPKTYTALAVGQHTFRVRAKDAAGNIDQSPATFTWTIQSATVDCGAQQTLTASADAWIDSGSTTSNKGSDSILKVMSKSGGNLRALVRFNLPTMPQGCSVESATLRLYAKSAKTGRTIQALQLAGSWTEGGVTWANQPQTTNGAVTVSSDTGYREWNVAGLVQSMYTTANNGFLVRDATENQDAEQQFHSREESSNRPQLVIKLGSGAAPAPPPPPDGGADTTPPDTTITGSPLNATSANDATFTFSGLDNVTPAANLTFECQLDVPDTSPWTSCTSPRSYQNLAVGSHIFRVRAKDAANNVDAQPAVYTWTIDQTDPETVITKGPDASTPSTSATFEFLSPETGSTFQCSLDLAAFAACASPATFSNLAVGQHQVQVRAVDAAGNLDETPASYPWTIQSGGTPVNCGPSQTLAAEADAWIDEGSTSSNKGTDGILKVMSKSGNKALRALVRFDLPTLPAGCQLDTAELRLYAGSSSSSERTLEVLRLDGDWEENGVNWGNAPDTAGDAVTTTSGSGYREWGVETLVQAMYSSGQENGFLVKDANEGQDAEQQFFAREKGESPPQLVLTFKPAS